MNHRHHGSAGEVPAVQGQKLRKVIVRVCWVFLALLIVGLLVPERLVMPVAGASAKDWHPKTFWYEPWGVSGVHKGIDIFAPEGRTVRAASPGLVVYRGRLAQGGNVVAVLGPKWRMHYYAHLKNFGEPSARWVGAGAELGQVGTTGNAVGKPPHLHYTIFSLVPIPWLYSRSETQGWQKMFYLDPGALLKKGS